MLSIFGTGIGNTIAIGSACVLKKTQYEIPNYGIKATQIPQEILRLQNAFRHVFIQYEQNKKQFANNDENTSLLEAYQLMLKDPVFLQRSIDYLQKKQINAEQSVQHQAQQLMHYFNEVQDSYLRSRKIDIQHLCDQIIQQLLGINTQTISAENRIDLSQRIIVSDDISPTQAILIKEYQACGVITNLGSQISHSAIVSRNVHLPAIFALQGSIRFIDNNDMLILDSRNGSILIRPNTRTLQQYESIKSTLEKQQEKRFAFVKHPCQTQDKKRIKLLSNIENKANLRQVLDLNSDGVGLFRTEYLFMDRVDMPDEQEQFLAYHDIAQQLQAKPLYIRTLDIGGDKQLCFDYPQKSSNKSSLGLRAIRLCLRHTELFIPQLRAILRASTHKNIALLIPMISCTEEVEQVFQLIKQTKLNLTKQKITYNSKIKIGCMVETPAAALLADTLAQQFDFLSIGTNDLIQYTLGIDRTDDAVSHLYNPTHPSVLKLIRIVLKAGKKHKTPVSLCGEMAGNTKFTQLLLGLGLKEFSMDTSQLLSVKEKIVQSDCSILKKKVKSNINSRDNQKIIKLLSQ